jgi:hypothetical protein
MPILESFLLTKELADKEHALLMSLDLPARNAMVSWFVELLVLQYPSLNASTAFKAIEDELESRLADIKTVRAAVYSQLCEAEHSTNAIACAMVTHDRAYAADENKARVSQSKISVDLLYAYRLSLIKAALEVESL